YLQTGFIRVLDAFEHYPLGQHLVEEQSPRVRRIIIRFEEISGGRAETAISESFESTDAQQVAAEGPAHTGFAQHLPGNNRANRVNARLQFAALDHVLINADIL